MADLQLPAEQVSADLEQEFEERLERAREVEARVTVTIDKDRRVVWTPQDGFQVDFLQCPIFELLGHGTRGGGKTDVLLVDFAQHVGQGFGPAWRGILFRETYPQLADVVAKSEKWFRQIFPGAKFNRSKMQWEWPNGEMLLFRHMQRPEDYWGYHGHEYPWIGWEELTNWATDECYKLMFACCRSSSSKVPRKVRATTNPYGIGHNWVMSRFELQGQWWKTIVIPEPKDVDGRPEPPRASIHSHIDENKILLQADPHYKTSITAAASNKAMAQAWADGSWDLIAGGMFDDVWDPNRNNVPDFAVPPSWKIDRAFDWGSSKPFSVGWYAQSDGSDLLLKNGKVMSTVRGDLFRVREWYGWTGKANEGKRMLAVDVAKGIIEREVLWGWRTVRGTRVFPGPADSSIYVTENGICIALDMDKPIRLDGNAVYHGVTWTPADKRPGSRKLGWEAARKMIRNARAAQPGQPREKPGLFVVAQHCPQFLRTVLSLPRDPKDLDDVDTDAEDHIGDELRYRIRAVGTEATSGRTVGMY